MSELSILTISCVSICMLSNCVESSERSVTVDARLSSRVGNFSSYVRGAVEATLPAIVPPVVMISSFLIRLFDIACPSSALSSPQAVCTLHGQHCGPVRLNREYTAQHLLRLIHKDPLQTNNAKLSSNKIANWSPDLRPHSASKIIYGLNLVALRCRLPLHAQDAVSSAACKGTAARRRLPTSQTNPCGSAELMRRQLEGVSIRANFYVVF